MESSEPQSTQCYLPDHRVQAALANHPLPKLLRGELDVADIARFSAAGVLQSDVVLGEWLRAKKCNDYSLLTVSPTRSRPHHRASVMPFVLRFSINEAARVAPDSAA